jgi:hypothetical protein
MRVESVNKVEKLRQEAMQETQALRQARQSCAKMVSAHAVQCLCYIVFFWKLIQTNSLSCSQRWVLSAAEGSLVTISLDF